MKRETEGKIGGSEKERNTRREARREIRKVKRVWSEE